MIRERLISLVLTNNKEKLNVEVTRKSRSLIVKSYSGRNDLIRILATNVVRKDILGGIIASLINREEAKAMVRDNKDNNVMLVIDKGRDRRSGRASFSRISIISFSYRRLIRYIQHILWILFGHTIQV